MLFSPWSGGAINLLVYNTNDTGPGSLRQALQDNVGLGGANAIIFSNVVTGTISLGSALSVSADVTITGPGAKVLTLSGNNSVRVFEVSGGTVSISGLTIANGFVATGNGGGILSTPSGGLAPITIQSCVFSNNSAAGASAGSGGAVYLQNPGTILNSTFVGNHSWGSGGGGGAIYDYGPLWITNCTFTGNAATNSIARGGAIFAFNLSGNAFIYSCTIASNTAASTGGGVQRFNGSVSIGNSIIAGNTGSTDPDVSSAFSSSGYNLVGNVGTSTGWTGVGDQVGTSGSPINAKIGGLRDYGGPTPTMAPQYGSPTIDQGKKFGATTDQRGFARTIDKASVPNATNGDGTDIGAVEVDPNFRIVDLKPAGTNVALSLMTVLGRNYRAEYTNNLASGTWTAFTNNAPGNGYLLWVTNSGGGNQAKRFYRGVLLP